MPHPVGPLVNPFDLSGFSLSFINNLQLLTCEEVSFGIFVWFYLNEAAIERIQPNYSFLVVCLCRIPRRMSYPRLPVYYLCCYAFRTGVVVARDLGYPYRGRP